MPFLVHGAQLAIAVAMFLLVNYLGRRSQSFGYISLSMYPRSDEAPAFNAVFRILTPIVLLLIVAAILYICKLDTLVQHSYMVIVYYFGIRIVFNGVVGRLQLFNWVSFVAQMTVTVVSAWLIHNHLISNRNILLPDLDTIGAELWLAVAGFLYLLLNKRAEPSVGTLKRKRAYIRRKYKNFTKQYGDIVDTLSENKCLRGLIYAVMFVESFNRPGVYRFVEKLLFRLGKAKTLGIMQVTTNKLISDRESVEIGGKRLVECHGQAVTAADEGELRGAYEHVVRHNVLVRYNHSGDYARDVEEIHDQVMEECYPDSSDRLYDRSGRDSDFTCSY